jgi:hypothetical protein
VRVILPFHRGRGKQCTARSGSPFSFSQINGGWDSAKSVRVIRVSAESRQYVWMLSCMWQRTVSSCLPRLAK